MRLTWLVEGEVAASGMVWPEDVAALRSRGIGAVLSLTEDDPFGGRPPPGLSCLHLPVPDMTAPPPAVLRRAVEFLRGQRAAGVPVLVHCGAGYGRTGTVLACWLRSEGLSAEEAIRRVRAARPGSVEVPEQEECVRDFVWEE